MWRMMIEINIDRLLSFFVILLVCAVIQFGSFSGLMNVEIKYRYRIHREYARDRYENATQISESCIRMCGDEAVVQILEIAPALWMVECKTDDWIRVENRPVLTDLLSQTVNTPLIISTFIILIILIIALIKRDYRPTKSICTLLRLPHPRSYYLLAKLFEPMALVILFWATQCCVALIQAGYYNYAVPKTFRLSDSSLWVFDYYRILYPFIEPIWFPATVSMLCMIPLVIVTFILIARGGFINIIYGILPVIGTASIVLVITRISNMWWIMPILLIAVYYNCVAFLNKGQIFQ